MRVCVGPDYVDLPPLVRQRADIEWVQLSDTNHIPQANLYVWSYRPGFDLQSSILAREYAQHLVLADSKDLDVFGPIQNFVCILLKPVSAFTFKAFFELALKTWDARQRAYEAEALRLDRDALLRYVLEVNLKLQEFDQERNNFLARVLHDFRTPLTALLGYCGLLAEGKFGSISESQRELLDRMCYSTKRLARLAGGALELLSQGRIEEGVKFREADIEEALRRALHEMYPFIKDKNLHMDVQVTPPEATLSFEPDQIQQVLINLLENSCKFTPVNGTIQVRGYPFCHSDWEQQAALSPKARTTNAYRVDISDSGPGVSPDLAEQIFEAYMSYPDVNYRSGAGLGLAICRAIVAAHSGVIWATPATDGGKFSFILPMRSKSNAIQGYSQQIDFDVEHASCQ
jgi:signal transduction histidine kinase